MNFMNKTVAVIGATGVVGSGIVRRYMDVGATVICVSRRQENLTKLRAELAPDGGKSLVEVVADFNDEEAAQEAGIAHHIRAEDGGQFALGALGTLGCHGGALPLHR